MPDRVSPIRKHAYNILAVLLCAFVLMVVNTTWLDDQPSLALFGLFGLALVFLGKPLLNRDLVFMGNLLAGFAILAALSAGASYLMRLFGFSEITNAALIWRLYPLATWPLIAGLVLHLIEFISRKRDDQIPMQIIDGVLLIATFAVFGYIFYQSEEMLKSFWVDGTLLGDRAGLETTQDFVIALIGLLLIIEATRRAIGWTLPILCGVFVLYGFYGQDMPDWLFPHRGSSWESMSQKTFLQSGTMCVFGIALRVMLKYVFLFVLFGTVLEQTGATGYIIKFARKMFKNSSGGPAKVAVLSSGLMGSLSGSAVANTATTGTFTIPLMKSTGFDSESAAGIEAAASSGGALMPPVMGAGAYMMLEIMAEQDPSITYLKIIQAALIPAILYYTALLLTVHFHAKRIGAKADAAVDSDEETFSNYQGFVFFGSFVILIAMLLKGFTAFYAVSVSLIGILVLSMFSRHTRLIDLGITKEGMGRFVPDLSKLYKAAISAARSGTALIVAASCVGIILGIVDMSGLGPALPAKVQSLAGDSAFLALLLLMVSTIILGMGLPSAVCYLLVALTVGSVLSMLDTPPLAAHLFIFYFGMMSMVTPPVALAAYAGAAIAKGDVMRSALAAFRFALVGFALPFAFVLRPELLMLTPENTPASPLMIVAHVGTTLVAILGLSSAIAGYAFGRLNWTMRILLLVFSLLVFFTRWEDFQLIIHLAAVALVAALIAVNFKLRNSA